MLKAFSTSATGMMAQEMLVDVVANNLANVNTTGFKRSQIEFQDLFKKGTMAERIIPLIDALEREEAPEFEKPVMPSSAPPEKARKKVKEIRRIFR